MAVQKTKITITTDDVVSIAEAAKALKVNFTTVWRWAQKGEINVVHIGKHLFIPKAELEILKSQRAKSSPLKGEGE